MHLTLRFQLKRRGYLALDALEPSKESLDYSRGKDIYTNYICEALGPSRLQIEDGNVKRQSRQC